MNKKALLVFLIAGLSLFSGCSTDNKNSIEQENVSSENVQQQEDKIEEEVKGENPVIQESEKIENNDTTSNSTNGIDIDIKDDTFITQMDKIYKDLDSYIGKTIKVEGFVLDAEDKSFKVLRLYDMYHLNHYDEVTVGINAVYEGSIPAEDSWVEVTGIIGKKSINGNEQPVVNVTKLEKKFSEGQKKVYN